MISRRVCLAAVVALGLTACFGSGPEAAVQGFYGAVAEGNTDKAMGFLALESVSANEMIMVKGKIQMMVAAGKTQMDANGGFQGVKITNQQEQGENALRVQLEILFKNGKTDQDSMNLIKQKDGWKIKL